MSKKYDKRTKVGKLAATVVPPTQPSALDMFKKMEEVGKLLPVAWVVLFCLIIPRLSFCRRRNPRSVSSRRAHILPLPPHHLRLCRLVGSLRSRRLARFVVPGAVVDLCTLLSCSIRVLILAVCVRRLESLNQMTTMMMMMMMTVMLLKPFTSVRLVWSVLSTSAIALSFLFPYFFLSS